MPVHRSTCAFCHHRPDPVDVEHAAVPSNVRAFKDQAFTVWRCPTCRSLHCRDIVNLETYYANYPIAKTLTDPMRVGLANTVARLQRHGLMQTSRVLDYGCGRGLLLQYLRECGYTNIVGYDRYSDAFQDRAALRPAAYDVIVLQDVIEHVEDPRALLQELHTYLAPGGIVLVGTPRADHIRLKPHTRDWLQLHPPYHLHIYTRAALLQLGAEQGWTAAEFYDRPYYDTRTVWFNARVAAKYQRFGDGTLDALFEPVPLRTLRRSPTCLFWAYFGYWFPRHTEMAVLFRKP